MKSFQTQRKKEIYDQVGHDGFNRGGYGSAANQAGGQEYQQGSV